MLKEVIIVEGKQDIAAVKKAVEAEVICTNGFALSQHSLKKIEQAYKKRGIIILTDPDSAGEKIRKKLAQKFPEAKHAFVPQAEASANNDIGIEQASIQAIRSALAKVRTVCWGPEFIFSWEDIVAAGLTGVSGAAEKRGKLGEVLGIGYANAKSFLYRLNHYGVTRRDFAEALLELERG